MLINLPTEVITMGYAACLANCLQAPLVLTLSGDLGAGKTTFIRAMLRALGIHSAIKSPTFSLVESYHCPHWNLHHFDLYRIEEESELDFIGFSDYFTADAVCCVEWPEKAPRYLTFIDMQLTLNFKKAGRTLQLKALSPLGAKVLACFESELCNL